MEHEIKCIRDVKGILLLDSILKLPQYIGQRHSIDWIIKMHLLIKIIYTQFNLMHFLSWINFVSLSIQLIFLYIVKDDLINKFSLYYYILVDWSKPGIGTFRVKYLMLNIFPCYTFQCILSPDFSFKIINIQHRGVRTRN